MKTLIILEFAKMRRQHLPLLAAGLLTVVVALSSMSLFVDENRSKFTDPQALPWAGLLLNYVFMSAMVAPLFTAIIASRVTEIEHSGNGWMMAAGSGIGSGKLCHAKLIALSLIIFPLAFIQSALLLCIGHIAGIARPIDWGPWLTYSFLLVFVEVAFCALHLCLSTHVENQLVGIGCGLLGSFIAVFCLLLPRAISLFIPWGYFAAIAPVGTEGSSVVYSNVPWLCIVFFLFVSGAIFMRVTQNFDRRGN